ncbi:MAG: NADH-quinone oxidoreductase subunit H [Bacteroidales bacterium]|nr:NADH-quinone oxidoreductase subunit H [Bacteroidales bacterium]
MAETLFYFLIYPGLLFAGVVGGLLSWFDRKITAQVQFRKGPPLLQPFYDFLKLLLVKETLLPARGARMTFLIAPVLGLFGATAAAAFILLPLFNIHIGFEGDVMVIFYLLTIPSLTYILGALASGNPLASVGASREIKLIVSYELTFLLFFAAIILKADQAMRMSEIIQMQAQASPFIGSISGVLLLIVGVFCIQAKLGMVPFDIAEAETELSEGSFIEYSGTVYALVQFTKYIMLFILPALIVAFLMSGFHLEGIGILWAVLKVLAVVLLLTLIRNTNPRLRIKQAMRFFLIGMNALVIIAIVLTYLGL